MLKNIVTTKVCAIVLILARKLVAFPTIIFVPLMQISTVKKENNVQILL